MMSYINSLDFSNRMSLEYSSFNIKFLLKIYVFRISIFWHLIAVNNFHLATQTYMVWTSWDELPVIILVLLILVKCIYCWLSLTSPSQRKECPDRLMQAAPPSVSVAPHLSQQRASNLPSWLACSFLSPAHADQEELHQ